MQDAMALAGMTRHYLQLGRVGLTSEKPLELWGTAPWLASLAFHVQGLPPLPAWKKRRLTTTDAGGGWTGSKQEMAASAEYPKEFCNEVAKRALGHH
jgi:hypothetical protein